MQRGKAEHPTRGSTDELNEFAHAIAIAIDKSEVRLVLKTAEYEEGSRKHRKNPDKRVRSRLSYPQMLAVQRKLARRFPERWGQHTPALSRGVKAPAGEEDDSRVTISITYAPPTTFDGRSGLPDDEPRGT